MSDTSGKNEGQSFTTPLAKLSLPRLARGIARARLFTVLDEGRQRAAAWIAAPAGAGKTTLAATYLLERQLPYLWYQLDKDDTDPATFFYYLGIAAKHASQNQNLFLPLLTPEYLPDIPGFARRYFRTLYTKLPHGMVLVLDNYQDLGDAAVFTDILLSAIGEIPQGAHLLVISRSAPPPELARHRATGALDVLDWETLRLTREETRAIVAHHFALDEQSINALHERSEGWAAAVTLLLEQIRRRGINALNSGPGSLETVFHFFASEFFDDLSEATRDFLLKTAFLSHITPTLAEQLSGNLEAGSILANLHRRHFFTHRRDLEETTYQYHALFRAFLLARAAETYSREQYLDVTRCAGRLLSAHHRQEEAVPLHIQAQDWEIAIPLLLSQAPHLLAQGRAQIVTGWLQQLPEALVESTPWLLYWKGVSQMSVRPFDALDTLRRAYSGFDAANDVMGEMLTASAIIDITYFLRQSLLSVTPWLEVLQKELALNPPFPSPAIEGRVLTSLLSVLMYMRPQDAQLPRYAERISTLLDSELDVNQKVIMGAHLVNYSALVAGNIEACELVAMRIKPLLFMSALTPLNELIWRCLSLWSSVLGHKHEDAYESILLMLALVKDNNLQFMEPIAIYYVLIEHISFNEDRNVESLFDRMEALLNPLQPADLAWHYHAKSWYALMQGDSAMSLSYGETALKLTSEVGAILIEMDISCLLAIACCESSKFEEAHGHLMLPRNLDFANSPRIRSLVHQVEAYAYLMQDELLKCHALLRKSFSIANSRGYFSNVFCWSPRMMTSLCTEALRAGIEVEHVRQLIRKRKLLPEDSTIEHWPWPVRIYTLGQFKVEIDDHEIPEPKAQRKPFALLQVLIALGGAEVKIDRIAEIVWPDAEGDAAVSAFTTTVSRLRKLIGEETIIVKGGRMSLNEHRCWVDVRALERQLDRAEDPENTDVRECAEKLLTLYRGSFLSDEEGEWAQRRRNRLREYFSRRLAQCIRALRTAEQGVAAARLLEKAVDVDADVEHLYRKLFPALISSP